MQPKNDYILKAVSLSVGEKSDGKGYKFSSLLTRSQVKHCTELIIVPSNISEITLLYFLRFFLFGDGTVETTGEEKQNAESKSKYSGSQFPSVLHNIRGHTLSAKTCF